MTKTKRNGIASKVFIVLIALTLISFCFLGSTFARYTSGGEGSAKVEVAAWKITSTTLSADTPATFGKLSPSMTGYSTGVADQTNKTAKTLVATIENAGDVDATVTLTAGATPKFFASDDTAVTFDATGYAYNSALTGSGASEAQAQALFSIKLYYGTAEGAANATTEITSGTTEITLHGALSEETTKVTKIYVYAEVTWTTAYANSQSEGVLEDAIDTWVGENVSYLTYDLSYLAVQGSQTSAS